MKKVFRMIGIFTSITVVLGFVSSFLNWDIPQQVRKLIAAEERLAGASDSTPTMSKDRTPEPTGPNKLIKFNA